jgi:predicted TIM-barrel fold metal-dependent hydrolase
MAEKYKKYYPDPSETAPIDIMPASNGEFIPPEPTPAQRKIMALQNEKIEETRRKFGMSRRQFVRTAAAYGIGVWAIDQVTGGKWGNYAFAQNTKTTKACDLENPGVQLANLPGEFILDTQGHALDSDINAKWRTQEPGFMQFLLLWTSQAMGDYPGYNEGGIRGTGGGEIDPVENLGRFHYFKEIFLDSSETVNLLTALPKLPDEVNITPVKWAAETRDMINNMTQSERCFVHAFTQPNRGYQGPGKVPAYQQEDFEWMANVAGPLDLRGWKLYCGWGDPGLGAIGGEGPSHNGWWFDDENGMAIVEHIRRIQAKTNRPAVICTHKGLAFNGTFDSAKFSPRDMGIIGSQFPDITFFTYHSGYDGEHMKPYAGDDQVNSSNRGVDCFIKSLRENGIDATRFVPKGLEHGNSPNMFAEIGTTWWANMSDADRATHLLGKLITYVGPRRIVWGSDCIWYGNPQPQIVLLRSLQFSEQAKELYNLPYGLDGDRWDPRKNALDGSSYLDPNGHPNVPGWPTDGRSHPERTIRNGILGRTAAEVYGLDPDATRHAMSCDEVQKIRDAYILNPGTPKETAPSASNHINGPRTRSEFFRFRKEENTLDPHKFVRFPS